MKSNDGEGEAVQDFVMLFLAFLFLGIPVLLTIWNAAAFVTTLVRKRAFRADRYIELALIVIGAADLSLLFAFDGNLTFADWNEQLVNSQLHSMISPGAFPTVITLAAVSLICFLLLRFFPARLQPPLVTAVGIAGAYIGIGLCVAWCVQTKDNLFLVLYPANCALLFLKAVFLASFEKARLIREGETTVRFKKLSALLGKAFGLPLFGLLLAIPLLGILAAVLTLFGQAPDSVIKAWTETADWTFSQKIPPQNVFYDEHYLCTVAAGGHRRIVRPLRVGMRHGHRVVVNRQLCVANAFEQLIEEKTPRFHRAVRGLYDRTGYPLAKHIRSPYLADAIWFFMKPLEWLFLTVLYAVDLHPEDRIAVQYPHSKPPER